MRFLVALLSLFALTLVPTVAAPAFASPAHASACHTHKGKPAHDPMATDCIAKCCTATPATSPDEPAGVNALSIAPTSVYRAADAIGLRSPPLPFEPPPPRIL